jgi:hypothetical protein
MRIQINQMALQCTKHSTNFGMHIIDNERTKSNKRNEDSQYGANIKDLYSYYTTLQFHIS